MSTLSLRSRGTMARRRALPAGSVLAVEIGADGWYADITFSALSTGGTYDLGLGALHNPDTGSPKLALTVTSLGFDDTGTATTVTRTVYGTKQVRKAYPNHGGADETVVGSDVKVRVALSDYVYAKDKAGSGNSGTDVVATVAAGLYSQGGTPSLASTVAATNSSTAPYQKVIGNWSWPGWEKITGASFTARCLAFERHGQSGRPVRCVKFTATDASANTATATVTAPTVDAAMSADALPVPEYVATLSSTSFTQGQAVTMRFQAYPWIGDSTSILDTSDGTAQPTALYGPRTLLCDKTGAYGNAYAVVDASTGNDGTGAVSATFDAGSPPAAFLTIAGAYNAMRTFCNTNYGRNNCGGGVIYLTDTAAHAWTGGTITAGTTHESTWVTFQNFPGDTPVISSQSGGKAAGFREKVVGINITAETATGVFAPGTNGYLWVHACTLNIPTNNRPLITQSGAGVWHATHNTVTALSQGFRGFSTNPVPCAVARGNSLGTVTNGAQAFMVIGNASSGVATFSIIDFVSGSTAPIPVNAVVAFNKIKSPHPSSPTIKLRIDQTESHGLAIVQNVVENTANVSTPIVQVAGDASVLTPVDNVIMWHNVFVGQRTNLAYNDTGSGTYHRRYWSVKNNIVDDPNIKADTFATENANRVGGWPVLYGVGHSGNLFVGATGIGAPGEFAWEHPGLSSDQPTPTGQPPSVATRAHTYPMFVDRKSFNGTSAGAGGGDYHVQAGSPAEGLQLDWLLSHDLAGAARAADDPVGAYA